MYKGTTLVQNIDIISEGAPYLLQADEQLHFGVKESADASKLLIAKTWNSSDQSSDGAVELKILPKETLKLPSKIYKYDIGLQRGEDYFIIVPESDFVVKNSITQW